MKFFLTITLLFAAVSIGAQSRRVAPQATPQGQSSTVGQDVTVKAMFDEANGYNKAKFAEYEAKKVPFSERLRLQTEQEQKQLAAKYAAIAAVRTNLAGEDLYYIGLLHWMAANLDGANDAFRKYLAASDVAPERSQTARTTIAIVAAKRKSFDDALSFLAEYKKNVPVRQSDVLRIEVELAKAYTAEKKMTGAVPHAAEAYRLARAIVVDGGVSQRGLDEALDTGMVLFEAHRALGSVKEADDTLADLRKTAGIIGSPSLFAYAADKLIAYMIESGRKPAAMELYLDILIQAGKEMPSNPAQDQTIRLLKKREKQYKLLGELAPELDSIDQWFPGKPKTFQSLRGKVVLLDFWATWCGPCFDAFPSLAEWHRDLAGDGLVVLGVTRYYGHADGSPMDNPTEIAFLKRFKDTHGLPYDFVVVKDNASQQLYAATGLPTAVLIDRKGVIRYIESGTNPTRIEELRAVMLKLLAEK